MGNVQKNIVEELKTNIICSKTFFSENRAFLDNVKKYCRTGQATDDNKTWRMHVTCLIPKVTGTHSEYVILTAFPLQICLCERS